MAAYYDTYDYSSYWKGREYEHASEVFAIKSFLARIKKISTILEIGAGYGRLVPSYAFRAKRIILSDPSSKLLSAAKDTFGDKENIRYVQTRIENLNKKVRAGSVDLVVMVRVLHHLENPDEAFQIINKILKANGYLILEFANKQHFKARVFEFLKGNFTFPLDIFPKEVTTLKRKNKTLPFLNYHPDIIAAKLEENGFEIVEKRSVSNIRSPFLKKLLGTNLLIAISKLLQGPLSYINFGPSIFLLAKKRTS